MTYPEVTIVRGEEEMKKLAVWTARPGNRRNRRRAGIVIPFIALVMVALCGIVGLAVDTGRLFLEKRTLQAAADAGAIGASRELARGNDYSAVIENAVLNDANLNGAEGSDITVNYPPITGPYAGDINYVEVLIEKEVATTFMRVVGPEAATVRVRSVAGNVTGVDFCMLALSRTATHALYVRGSGILDMDCGAQSNSGSPSGLVTSGTLSFTARSIASSGGYVDEGTGTGLVDPDPVENVVPAVDPLGQIPSVNFAGWPSGYYDDITMTYMCPGGHCVWPNELVIEGGAVTKTFQPGIHVLLNGMTLAGQVTVNAYETMFYVAGGNIVMEGGVILNQTPPLDGTYRGMAVFMSRSLPSGDTTFGAGSSTYNFKGVLYAPTRHMYVAGGSLGDNPWAMFIADTVEYAGTSDLYLTEPPKDEIPDINHVTLVE